MKICVVPGDIGQANAQILQDRIGPGQNCCKYCYCCRSTAVGKTEGITQMIQSLCGLIYLKNLNLRPFYREFFKKALCVKSPRHSEQNLLLLT